MPVKMRPKPVRVTSKRIKTYLDAVKHDTVLLGPVSQWLQRQTDDRNQTVIHPSEMAAVDWCPRATWHRLVNHPAAPSGLPLRANLIFEEGRDIHKKWQRWLRHMGVIWGVWVCRVCHDWQRCWANELPSKCPEYQGNHIWSYKEVPLESASHRIEGHADGIINPTYDEPMLLEIKSVGPGTLRSLGVIPEDVADEQAHDHFSRITRPATAHFRQTQIYLRLAEQWAAEVGPVKRGLVIYEYKSDQQVREFVMERDDKWTDPLFEMADDIVWAIGKGRSVRCPHGGCARCRAYEEEQ